MYGTTRGFPTHSPSDEHTAFALVEPVTPEPISPADVLIDHLGLQRRSAREARDLYAPRL